MKLDKKPTRQSVKKLVLILFASKILEYGCKTIEKNADTDKEDSEVYAYYNIVDGKLELHDDVVWNRIPRPK